MLAKARGMFKKPAAQEAGSRKLLEDRYAPATRPTMGAGAITLKRIKGTLHANGVAASISAVDLCTGFTRAALLDPLLLQLDESDVPRTRKPPKIRAQASDMHAVMQWLVELGILVMSDECDNVRDLADRTEVTGGMMFGVKKPHSSLVLCSESS